MGAWVGAGAGARAGAGAGAGARARARVTLTVREAAMREYEQCDYCRKLATDMIDSANVCRREGCRTLARNEAAEYYVSRHWRELEKEFGEYTKSENSVLKACRDEIVAARRDAGTMGRISF